MDLTKRLLFLILFLISPKLVLKFSVNESFGPVIETSMEDEFIPLSKEALVSIDSISLSFIIIIV